MLETILTPYILEVRNNFMVNSIVFDNANFDDNFATLCFLKYKK